MKKSCNNYCDNIHGTCYNTYRGGGCPGFILRPEKEKEFYDSSKQTENDHKYGGKTVE